MLKKTIFCLVVLGLAIAAAAPAVSLAAPREFSMATEIPSSTSPAPSDDDEATPQDNFGTRALGALLHELNYLHERSKNITPVLSPRDEFSAWLFKQTADQNRRDRWINLGQSLVMDIGSALAVSWVLQVLLLPLRRQVVRLTPATITGRLFTLTGYLVLKLLPIMVLVAISVTLLDIRDTTKFSRAIIVPVLYAIALQGSVWAIMTTILMPFSDKLRLLPLSAHQAKRSVAWLTAYSLIIIYGYFLIDLIKTVGMPTSVTTFFGHALGLWLVAMSIAVVLISRTWMTHVLQNNLLTTFAKIPSLYHPLAWLAKHWHRLAIAYLVIGYGITLSDAQNGFALMLRGTAVTVLILATLRAAFMFLAYKAAQITQKPQTVHYGFLLFVTRLGVTAAAVLVILAGWGFDLSGFFATALGQKITGACFSIGITIIIAALLYEILYRTGEHLLNLRDAEGNPLPVSSRTRTLVPLLRHTALVILGAIIGLITLSELGVNTGPLLAGAGIVGVAVGFGSQTLVKDFLTGLFIIVENTIAIGDVVKIGDHIGTVEAMSLRTLRLRDMDGGLHILPFSEVSQIVNMSKDFAYALVDVGIGYDSNIDHVMDIIRDVGDQMRNDPVYKSIILEPTEILGVEKLGDYAITLRARLRTQAGKQWEVRRMFLLRIRQRFEHEGIEFPFPTSVQFQKQVR